MKKPGKILIGIVLTIAIIGTGLAGGIYFSQNKKILDLPPSESVNNNTYVISPPSRADALRMFPIDIQPVGNTSFVMMPANKVAEIKTGQKILLYKADGTLLEILGEITTVDKGTDALKDFVTIHLVMKETPAISAKDAVKGNIVLQRFDDAQRLPLTALVQGKEGADHIWEAFKNEDGTDTAFYKAANVSMTGDGFFVLDPATGSGNVFILNPDDSLKDGQKINIREDLFSVSAQSKETAMLSLLETRQQEKMEARRVAALATQGGAVNSGCEVTPQTTSNFINSIKEIAPGPVSRPPDAP